MSTTAIALFVLGGGLLTPADTQSPTASAQFAVARDTASQKVARSAATPPGTGGYLNVDDCNAGSTALGSGSMAGVPFTTGTTGVEHQNEPLCYAFGTSGITNDVWFNWSAATTGNVVVDFCGSSIDTKVASYNDDNGGNCPLGGALACNDDSCGLQSTISFAVTASSSYVLQVGTFPGASGGSGSFNITETTPPPCGQYDDGSTENALGLTAGGEIAWLHHFNCLNNITEIHTAYGAAAFPGTVTNGNGSKIFVHTDTDSDPTNGTTWLETINTTVTNGNTDILNQHFITSGAVSGSAWVGASADQISGEFPGPMDQGSSGPQAWVVGNTAGPGTLDEVNLSNNNFGPLQMNAIGFPAYWLLRAVGDGGGGCVGTSQCFGDGSGTACPCGNAGGAGEGCANSTGSGSTLCATGSTSIAANNLVLTATNALPGQPGLFFQGDVSINGGNGIVFGDGLRCCGTNVIRIQVVLPDAGGTAATTDSISGDGGVSAGQTKCYQFWYRNPAGGPCGTGFNLTNAVSITWTDSGSGPGTPYGFCDGSGTPAPCGNTGAPGNGCANSAFSSGCNLFATGIPSVSADTIVLHGDSAVPSQFGLYFQGDVPLNPGTNCVIFGDGLRCAGVNVRRLQTIQASLTGGPGSSSTTVCISCAGGVLPGDTKYYQLWYRDPGGPCNSGFNLSNGLAITWAP